MTKKTKLVPFDLQKALKGHKLMTKGGLEVLEIVRFEKRNNFNILALFNDREQELKAHRDDGTFCLSKTIDYPTDEWDLMLEVEFEERTFYVQILPCEPEGFKVYKTYEEAYENSSKYLEGILKVSYTEEDLIK